MKTLRAKSQKIIRKVNRAAYDFRPDVLVVVGVDLKRGRIVTKELRPLKAGFAGKILLAALAGAAREFCTVERTRLGLHLRPCRHPWGYKRRRTFTVEEGVKGKALFCTKCGKRLGPVQEINE